MAPHIPARCFLLSPLSWPLILGLWYVHLTKAFRGRQRESNSLVYLPVLSSLNSFRIAVASKARCQDPSKHRHSPSLSPRQNASWVWYRRTSPPITTTIHCSRWWVLGGIFPTNAHLSALLRQASTLTYGSPTLNQHRKYVRSVPVVPTVSRLSSYVHLVKFPAALPRCFSICEDARPSAFSVSLPPDPARCTMPSTTHLTLRRGVMHTFRRRIGCLVDSTISV